jgi:hypothetical protein
MAVKVGSGQRGSFEYSAVLVDGNVPGRLIKLTITGNAPSDSRLVSSLDKIEAGEIGKGSVLEYQFYVERMDRSALLLESVESGTPAIKVEQITLRGTERNRVHLKLTIDTSTLDLGTIDQWILIKALGQKQTLLRIPLRAQIESDVHSVPARFFLAADAEQTSREQSVQISSRSGKAIHVTAVEHTLGPGWVAVAEGDQIVLRQEPAKEHDSAAVVRGEILVDVGIDAGQLRLMEAQAVRAFSR